MEPDIDRDSPYPDAALFGELASDGVTVLPQLLDLVQAQPLRDRMAALLNRGAVTLDAAAVERMSTPCIQVLLATARSADAAGMSFVVRNASAPFLTALADLGLQPEFSKWID